MYNVNVCKNKNVLNAAIDNNIDVMLCYQYVILICCCYVKLNILLGITAISVVFNLFSLFMLVLKTLWKIHCS